VRVCVCARVRVCACVRACVRACVCVCVCVSKGEHLSAHAEAAAPPSGPYGSLVRPSMATHALPPASPCRLTLLAMARAVWPEHVWPPTPRPTAPDAAQAGQHAQHEGKQQQAPHVQRIGDAQHAQQHREHSTVGSWLSAPPAFATPPPHPTDSPRPGSPLTIDGSPLALSLSASPNGKPTAQQAQRAGCRGAAADLRQAPPPLPNPAPVDEGQPELDLEQLQWQLRHHAVPAHSMRFRHTHWEAGEGSGTERAGLPQGGGPGAEVQEQRARQPPGGKGHWEQGLVQSEHPQHDQQPPQQQVHPTHLPLLLMPPPCQPAQLPAIEKMHCSSGSSNDIGTALLAPNPCKSVGGGEGWRSSDGSGASCRAAASEEEEDAAAAAAAGFLEGVNAVVDFFPLLEGASTAARQVPMQTIGVPSALAGG
jgi:hypothetical protein